MDTTDNLELPYIVAAQAQKHVTHNEALRTLDALVQLAVLDKDLGAPPPTPSPGDRYIVAAAPVGAWAGEAGHVAVWADGAWTFHAPLEGWLAWVADEGRLYAWTGTAWTPLPAAFDTGTGITDAAGNPQLLFTAAPDAVNHLHITNAPTATAPHLAADGSDQDIDLALAPKGAGVVRSDGRMEVVSGAYPPFSAERTTSDASTPLSPQRLLVTTSGDMVDGFGPILGFSIRDNAGVLNEGIATVRAMRSGADNSGRLQLTTLDAGTQVVSHEMAPAGNNYFPNIGTTASAANAFLNSSSIPSNELLRSTSSQRYKREVEDVDDRYADKILGLRPVWYRSAISSDRQDWSHYGLIAEEVAEVDPRLVHWSYRDEDWELVHRIEGDAQLTERRLEIGAQLVPDGVAYERLTVLLLNLVKRQQMSIEAFQIKLQTLLENQCPPHTPASSA